MTALSSDATSMANLLAVLTQPDTEAIRQAELALKPILKDPRCVPALVEILKARDSQVRLVFIFVTVAIMGMLNENLFFVGTDVVVMGGEKEFLIPLISLWCNSNLWSFFLIPVL
jgi:hypothetical protein